MDNHRVRRLRWYVRLPSRDEAFDVRRRLRDSVNDEMVPAIGRAFDAAGVSSRVVHIRQLHLRARASGSGTIEEASLASIREQLMEQLASMTPDDRAATDGVEVRVEAPRDYALAILLHYLRSGVLPWHATGTPGPTASAGLTQIAHDELRALIAAVPHEPGTAAIFVFRLLALLPPVAWPVLARHVQAEFAGSTDPAVVSTIEQLAASAGEHPRSSVHLRLASAVITAAALPPLSPSEAERVRTTLNVRPGDVPSHPELERFDLLRELFGRGRSSNAPAVPTSNSAAAIPPVYRPAFSPGSGRHDAEPVHGAARRDQEPDAVPFGMPVSSAGVVLLAPFLAGLFEARGIAMGTRNRIAMPDLPRACALLHYAATGRQDGQEFELGFVKVLLGLSPESPVPFSAGLLEPGDSEEVDRLLTAVIGHWQVLKNASIDGLRSSFLQRPGLVVDEPHAWRLRVESSGLDPLLARLPWSISFIVLPWCTEPIQTDWASS